jgi:polysaccharide export outer membrane protein
VKELKNGYLNDPKVSVEVLNYRPFFITGEVKNGGEYPYKAGLTVQDAVGVAGGYTYRAETATAYLRRAGEDREIKVSLDSRVPINPGDSIRIPERFF